MKTILLPYSCRKFAKKHKNSEKDAATLGAVHKLRYADEVGRWSAKT